MVLAALVAIGAPCHSVRGQQAQPPKNLQEVRDAIKSAGQLYKDRKFADSAAALDVIQTVLPDLVLASDKKDLPEWERVHRQLTNAIETLELEGAELQPLPPWAEFQTKIRDAASGKSKPKSEKPAPDPKNTPAANSVSFSKDIAPWLVETCGRCHVDKESGGFGMPTYEALIKGSKAGVVLFPGDPDSSPLVTVMEGGTMPPNGNKVPANRIALLKDWIKQGAKFDREDPKAPLKTLLGNAPADEPKPKDMPIEVTAVTGKETVSFSTDIAPLIVANCNGCHYGGNRLQGGLSLNNFAGLLKGGASGPIVAPGKGDDSLLVKKLRGMVGARMPAGGRPPLSDEDIQRFKTWIDEGAKFDGDSRDSQLDSVIAKSWASKAGHAELSAKRQERARARWQIISPKSKPDEAVDDEFHVLSNAGEASTKQVLESARSAAKTLRKQFKLNSKDPLVKGGITIYAMKSRYDYSELGTMLEKRSLPPDWSGHWKRDVLDNYIAIVFDKSDGKLNEANMLQQIASVWIASHDGVPKWFADGIGRNALATAVGPNDARVQPWVRRLPQVVTDVKNVQPLLKGGMNDEDEAIIGFGIVKNLQQKPMKRQYDQLMKGLEGGSSFEDSFTKAFGPVEAFLSSALGKPAK